MGNQDIDTASFATMLLDTNYPWCWQCGRMPPGDRPTQWNAPWLLHRAHLVNKPRVEDRRVCVLLCPKCHTQFDSGCGLSLAEMLWIKRKFDPAYYDRPFMQKFATKKLPAIRQPNGWIYNARRGQPKRILTLRMKGKYWDQIKDGTKTTELRLRTDYWRKRLIGREYDEIHLWRGYPPKSDTSKLLVRKWRLVSVATVLHEEFGPEPVDVFCIDVAMALR